MKQNLTDRAIDMKDLSEDLLQDAKDADRELNGNLSLHLTRPNQLGHKKSKNFIGEFSVPTKMLRVTLPTSRSGWMMLKRRRKLYRGTCRMRSSNLMASRQVVRLYRFDLSHSARARVLMFFIFRRHQRNDR